jgi:hypothetical protein
MSSWPGGSLPGGPAGGAAKLLGEVAVVLGARVALRRD